MGLDISGDAMCGFTTHDFACDVDLEGVKRAITTHAVPNSAMRH